MNHRISAVCIVSMGLGAGTALAQGGSVHGWYVGLDYGQSKLDRVDANPNVVERNYSSDSFAVRLGYRFARYFSLEAGYADIGDFSASYISYCSPVPGVVCPVYESRTSIDGFLLNAIGTWPVTDHFHLKGVLGATWRELSASVIYPTETKS